LVEGAHRPQFGAAPGNLADKNTLVPLGRCGLMGHDWMLVLAAVLMFLAAQPGEGNER
jgi:hypothetical protein